MQKTRVDFTRGFIVSAETSRSFSGTRYFYELSGPFTLARLVQFHKVNREGLELRRSRIEGLFWFELDHLLRLRAQARRELMSPNRGQPYQNTLGDLIGQYLRHSLRGDLAVSKDWTEDFDAYITLRVLPGEKLIALVGRTAPQPAYSRTHPRHRTVVANNIWLPGGADQYVIHFDHDQNRPLVDRIMGPWTL